MGQEQKKKEKRPIGKQKYLNNFVRNSEGTYVYVGRHIHWGEERKKGLLCLWIPAAVQTVLVLLCGCMPKAGMEQRFYVLLPYLAMFIGVFLQLWKIIDLSFAGKDIRDYIFKRTVPVLRVLPWTIMGASVLTFAAETVRAAQKDFTQYRWASLFLAGVALIAVCSVLTEWQMRRMQLFREK